VKFCQFVASLYPHMLTILVNFYRDASNADAV